MAFIELKAQSIPAKAISQTIELQQEMLDSLEARIKNTEIVGIGEVSHGALEATYLKTQLIKFLVNEMNFRQILFELDDATIRPLNKYLTNNVPPEKKRFDFLFDSLFNFTVGGAILNNEKFKEQMSWVKDFNMLHPNDMVNMRGVDIFVSFEIFRDNYMDSASVNLIDIKSNKRYLSPKETDELVKEWFTKEKKNLKLKYGDEVFKNIQMDVNNFHNKIKYYENGADKNRAMVTYRDSIMFNNLFALKNGKAILLAHNGHIGKSDYVLNLFRAKTLGHFLAEAYDDKYYAILTDYIDQAEVTLPKNTRYKNKVFKNSKKTMSSNFKTNQEFFQLLLFNDDPLLKNLNRLLNIIGLDKGHKVLEGDKNIFDAIVLFKELTPLIPDVRKR
jgi:erythromycin esterase